MLNVDTDNGKWTDLTFRNTIGCPVLVEGGACTLTPKGVQGAIFTDHVQTIVMHCSVYKDLGFCP